MADYHAILKRAISALPSPTGEARRTIYEKARTALVTQLKSFDPPLPPSEITQQRLQLEDAIRKVESEAAKGLLRQPPPAAPPVVSPTPAAAPVPVAPPAGETRKPEPAPPAQAPLPGSQVEMIPAGAVPPPAPPREEPVPVPPPPPSAMKRAVTEADQLGAATAQLGRQARDALRGDIDETTTTTAFGREGETAARKADTRERRKRREAVRRGGTETSRLPLIAGVLVAILVIGIGVVALWSQRDTISAFFGGAKAPMVDLAARGGEKLAPKSSDRLASDEAANRAGAVKPVPTQTITPSSSQVPQLQAPIPSTPAPSQIGETTKPADVVPGVPAQAVPLVAQRAILYEEGKAGGGQAQISPGKVVWSVTPDPTDPKPGAMLLKARVEIPDRGIVTLLQMHPNGDTSFPASHLIEIKFNLPADFDGKSITNVPGLIMKATEQARGDPLSGASAKVSDNFFWIALGAAEADRTRNLKMIRERGWIDVPVLYENGRRAILTLEKAGAGDQAVKDAFAAWGQS